jgi:hypothetical protein
MQSLFIWKGRVTGFAVAMLILLLPVGLLAQNNKKPNSPEPARPAAPARSAPPPSRPSGGGAPGMSHGPAPSGVHGPTTSNPGVQHGPTANGPTTSHAGPTANGPTTSHASPATHGPSTSHAGPTTHGTVGRNAGPSAGAMKAMGTPAGGHPANTGILGRTAPKGSQQVQLKSGSAVQRRANGKVSDLHDAKRGMNIHHGINGNTRVVVERGDHSRVFAERGRPGYVQRGYMHNGHEYSRRTYYYQGRAYDRYYRGYPYRGVYLNVYSPYRYYPVGFYGWAYNPWYQPVVYSWGWGGSPWYGYYGGYFTPYPVYATASLWLTDYIISSQLAAAYQARQEAQVQMDQEAAGGSAQGAAPLTPEVKQMIADEVKSQLALENSEAQQNAQNQEPDPASSGIARILSDGKRHVFVASGALDVVDAAGTECAISDGDALEMVTPPPPSATSANLVVLSSKGGRECAKSDTVAVALTDLQDMQNHMRETIDQGLQELQSKQGTGGLPATPPSAKAPPVDAPIARDAPPPDPNGAAEVNQQLADADQAEKEVVGEAQQEGGGAPSAAPAVAGPASGPATIALGQSIDEVTAALGTPLTVIDLGPKKIYKYKDMKVTFKNGKVSDVE